MMQVSDEHQQLIRSILLSLLPEAQYWLFGSRIQGTAKEYSDLDVAIVHNELVPLDSLSELEEPFANSDILYKLDLVCCQRVSPEFQAHIKNNYVLLLLK